MYSLSNGLNLKLSINGIDLPTNDDLSFHYLQLTSDVKYFLPMMVIQFSDQSSLLRRYGIEIFDGVQLTVSLGATPDTVKIYHFRLFHPKQQFIGALTVYRLYGLLDAPKYLAESNTTIYPNQTSSQVIQTIAQNCGLNPTVVQTSDTQTWRQGNKRNCDMVRHCALHGWAGDQALLAYGIRLDGSFYYLDVNQITPSNVYLSYSDQTQTNNPVVQIVDHKFDDPMGKDNLHRGWNSTFVDQNNSQTSLTSLVNNTQVRPNANAIAINQALSTQMNAGKVEHSPIYAPDMVHSNWSKARHQNIRGKVLHNMTCHAFTPTQTALDLFAPINIDSSFSPRTYDPSQGAQNGREGQYIVAGRSIIVSGVNYGEKLRAVRPGINSSQPTG